MAQLQFAVNHQIISRTDNFKPVAESKNYLYAHFTFETDEWSDVVATAIFRNDTAAKEVLIDQNGDCLVPWEIIQNNGDVIYVSCFAGDLITVNMARVRIYETGYGDDLESATPPTPSVYAQIIDRMDGIETAVEDATERTEAAAALAAEAVAHYPKIEDNYWYVWDAENEEFVNTGVRAEAEDGTSATVVVTPITNGHRVTITDADGDHVFDVMDGASSTISVSNITGGHRLTITDKTGVHTVDVMDGTKGNDGYSPTVSITDIPGGYNVTITDKSGAHSYNILNGSPGAPGFSPIVSTTAITGGHKITIQDKYQTQYFDVMDGSDYVLTQQDKQDIAALVDVPGATFHICVSGEYDPSTRVPTIQNPQGDVFYLVPSASATSPDMFTEWIWTNNAWEMFGSATIDLSNYVQFSDIDSSLSDVSEKPVQNKVVKGAVDGKTALTVIAPAYSASSTYAVGNYVTHGGYLYRCTTAITTAEAWNAAHWTLATIGEILKAIPTGGTTGQVLRKQSNDDFSSKWDRETVTDVQINGSTILDADGVANVPVDDALSPTSTNPVQNKVITGKIGELKAEINQLSDEVNGMAVYDLVTSQNSIDVTAYQGETIKATSEISASTASDTFELYCCGKNHVRLGNHSGSFPGFTWESKEDGTVILNGTADRNINLKLNGINNTLIGEVPCFYNTKWRASLQKSAENNNVALWFNGAVRGDVYEFGAFTTAYAKDVQIRINQGTVCDNLVVRLMIEFGDYPETITYEPFYGFVETYTFDTAVTTGNIDWGVLTIPENATTLWMYDTTNITSLYLRGSVSDAIEALSAEVNSFADDIEGAYSHDYVAKKSGWSDVDYTSGGYIGSNGNVSSNGSFRYSDYIPVKSDGKIDYNLYGYSSTVYIVTFYNASKSRVSGIVGMTGYKSGETPVPEGAAYVRFSGSNSNAGTFTIYEKDRVTGDEAVANIYGYIDDNTSITGSDIVITRGDLEIIEGSIYANQSSGIYPLESGRRTDYIPVSPGDYVEYRLWNYVGSAVVTRAIAVFNEDKNIIDYVSFSESGYGSGTYTIPANGAYVMISWSWAMQKDGWFAIHVATFTQELANMVKSMKQFPNTPLKGKQWCCLGDSITYGANTTKTYANFIEDRCAITPYNFGKSNTAIAKTSASVTDNIASRYPDMFDGVDYVTVFGGTNDHGQNIPIGQWGDSDELTLYGAMKILVEGLVDKYVGKKIGFILPLPKYGQTGGVYQDYSYPNASFMPYIECIHDVCKRYSIPVLDLYLESGLVVGNADVRSALIPDGLHPNATGHEFISWQIQKFLERI